MLVVVVVDEHADIKIRAVLSHNDKRTLLILLFMLKIVNIDYMLLSRYAYVYAAEGQQSAPMISPLFHADDDYYRVKSHNGEIEGTELNQ